MKHINLTETQLSRWEVAVKATTGYDAACKTFGIDREEWIASEINRLDSIDRTAAKKFLDFCGIDVAEEKTPETDVIKTGLWSAIRDNFIDGVGWDTMKVIFCTGVDVKIDEWVMTVFDVPEYLAQNEDEEVGWLHLKERVRNLRKWG